MKSLNISGYRRENGKVGIRNHVILLPVDDISNTVCEAVSNNIKNTLALPHAYGRLQFGRDLDLFFRTIIGIGTNPNVAAAVVIGVEPEWAEKVAEAIAETGKPVSSFSIERNGDLATIEKASRKAQEYSQWASELKREECGIDELYISMKCGESDTTSGLAANPTVGAAVDRLAELGATLSFGETTEITGAEMLCKDRAATPEVGEQFMKVWTEYNDLIMEEKHGDLSGSQPSKGNIRGGLTTIEEKAFGNLEKIGNIQYVGVLDYAESPKGKGLWFMNTSSAAAEAITLWAASGAVLHLFPTGQGNIIGHPIEPVIKISGNPLTCETMKEHIDVNVSGILTGDLTVQDAGEKLTEMIVRTAKGRLTAAEVLGHREFVLTKLYRSA